MATEGMPDGSWTTSRESVASDLTYTVFFAIAAPHSSKALYMLMPACIT